MWDPVAFPFSGMPKFTLSADREYEGSAPALISFTGINKDHHDALARIRCSKHGSLHLTPPPPPTPAMAMKQRVGTEYKRV